MHHFIEIIGQIIFGGFFIWSGINHFIGLKGMAGFAKSKKVPMPTFSVAFSGLMLLAGGLAILTGFEMRAGIIILVIFILLATFLFHSFWNTTDKMARMNEVTGFTKNMAILGALLMLLAK